VITDAELRALLADCLKLWDMPGEVTAEDNGLRVGACVVRRGPPPMRWIVETPARTRAVPSVVALLSTLRRSFDVQAGPFAIPGS
jgi:hypothetical protein